MSRVNPPRQLTLPRSLASNPDMVKAFGDRDFIANQLWVRTGSASGLPINLYNNDFSYLASAIVFTEDGKLWNSKQATQGNAPEIGVYWEPAIDEERTRSVRVLTGGGGLNVGWDNELHDGGSYTLPLSNSVDDGNLIDVSLPSTYAAFNPTVSITGSDLISYKDGTDTSITFKGATTIRLTSNGTDRWVL